MCRMSSDVRALRWRTPARLRGVKDEMQVRSRCFRPERWMRMRLKVWSLETRAPERDSQVRPATGTAAASRG